MCTCPCGSTLNAAPIVTEVDLVGAHNGGDTDIHTPHAYSPGALLGAWARPAPIPNKLLAGHLVNPGIFFKIANCSTTTQWREY